MARFNPPGVVVGTVLTKSTDDHDGLKKRWLDLQPARVTALEARGPGLRGPTAIAALAVGATALGAVAIGRLVIRRAAIKQLRIEELEVGRLRVRELEIESGGPPAATGSTEPPLGPPD